MINKFLLTKIIEKNDIIAQAQSGTGKTATFSIGMLECIDENIKGVVIVNVKQGSVADEKGLKKGDVIIQVNRVKISSTDELKKLNEEAKRAKKTSVLMLILRNGMRRFIGLPTQ